MGKIALNLSMCSFLFLRRTFFCIWRTETCLQRSLKSPLSGNLNDLTVLNTSIEGLPLKKKNSKQVFHYP